MQSLNISCTYALFKPNPVSIKTTSDIVSLRSAEKDKDKKRAPSESDEKALSSWMSSINAARLSSHDRQLLDTLKSKIKRERIDDDERETKERASDAHRKLR